MMAILAVPYTRIPLLLHFFTSCDRESTLLNLEICEVLESALFSPGDIAFGKSLTFGVI